MTKVRNRMFWTVLVCAFASGVADAQEIPRSPAVPDLLKGIAKPVPEPVAITWERVVATPEGYIPQGLTARDGRLFLSAHASDSHSSIFEFDTELEEPAFVKRFDLPESATHASGIDFHPANTRLLVCVDYNSDRIYGIDFPRSCEAKKAVVLSESPSDLQGTSACCLFRHDDEWKLLVTDFRATSRNYVYKVNSTTGEAKRTESSFKNWGFSQGIKRFDSCIFESGNSLLRSYIVLHSPIQSLQGEKLVPLAWCHGPDRGVEDIVVHDGFIYVSSEDSRALYRAKLPQLFVDRVAGKK